MKNVLLKVEDVEWITTVVHYRFPDAKVNPIHFRFDEKQIQGVFIDFPPQATLTHIIEIAAELVHNSTIQINCALGEDGDNDYEYHTLVVETPQQPGYTSLPSYISPTNERMRQLCVLNKLAVATQCVRIRPFPCICSGKRDGYSFEDSPCTCKDKKWENCRRCIINNVLSQHYLFDGDSFYPEGKIVLKIQDERITRENSFEIIV